MAWAARSNRGRRGGLCRQGWLLPITATEWRGLGFTCCHNDPKLNFNCTMNLGCGWQHSPVWHHRISLQPWFWTPNIQTAWCMPPCHVMPCQKPWFWTPSIWTAWRMPLCHAIPVQTSWNRTWLGFGTLCSMDHSVFTIHLIYLITEKIYLPFPCLCSSACELQISVSLDYILLEHLISKNHHFSCWLEFHFKRSLNKFCLMIWLGRISKIILKILYCVLIWRILRAGNYNQNINQVWKHWGCSPCSIKYWAKT